MSEFKDLKIVATWEVSDNYIGKARPQETTIYPLEHMERQDWENLNENEKKEFIEAFIQDDLEKISYSISNFGL